MNAAFTTQNYQPGACAPGTVTSFESINTPGCYVCNWSGHLLRVPEAGINPGRGSAYQISGGQSLQVTMISQNPFIALTKARLLAANFNLPTNF